MLRDWLPMLLIALAVIAIVFGHKRFIPDDSLTDSLSTPPTLQLLAGSDAHRLQCHPIPGVSSPILWNAAQFDIADDVEVIGVCAEGCARAYLVAAMSGAPDLHVVNDLFDDQPITITHCDTTGCTRVFAGNRWRTPLSFCASGSKFGLVLQIDDRNYLQATKRSLDLGMKIPYSEFPHMQTTWGHWLATHPDTEVYIGRLTLEKRRSDNH